MSSRSAVPVDIYAVSGSNARPPKDLPTRVTGSSDPPQGSKKLS
jgi:hypothetical protein